MTAALVIGLVAAGFAVAGGVPGSLFAWAYWQSRRRFVRLPSGALSSREGPSAGDVDAVLTIVAERYATQFKRPSADVRAVMRDLVIVWHEGSFGDPRFPGKSFNGLTVSPTEIHVADFGRGLAYTALVHELVHVILWRLEGNPDADHEATDLGDTWGLEHTRFVKTTNALIAPS